MTIDAVSIEGAERLEEVIGAAAARCRQRPGAIDGDEPFSLLGLDSLRRIELAAELEDVLGRSLPEDLLDGCPDVRSLAVRLHRICTLPRDVVQDPYELMLADAVLPEDVCPAGRVAASPALGGARRILLTGATGFLGAALAREILQQTGATLVCLARPGGGVRADTRVRELLVPAPVCCEAFERRVRVVDGDLSRPLLGLEPSAFDTLASEVDAICHAAAAVNWATSYAGLRAPNVAGTLELLRLACRKGVPFHFVSSLSVCYSSSAAPEVDETFDALTALRGVHLGYAQSKIVGEALVREAGRRGLPVRIYRPGLISGDSRTGWFNRDDLLSTLIRGCVRMGAAPDLDWTLDALPVDVGARAIIGLSGEPGPFFHLAHPRPRHWRECVLWMRLYGYPLRLVPYAAWLRRLELETESTSAEAMAHPLRALRGFFLTRPEGEHGLTLPELYEEGRRTRAVQRRTMEILEGKFSVSSAPGPPAHWPPGPPAPRPWSCPPLDAALLDTYFAAYIRGGELPPPATPTRGTVSPVSLDAAFFGRVTGLDVTAVQPLSAGSDHSIVSELAGWRSRRPTGLFRFRLDVNTSAGRTTRDVVVKSKPRDTDVIDAGEALAHICDPAVGAAYTRWRDRLGMTGSHMRELAIYSQTDPRFVAHAPQVLAAVVDPNTDMWLVVLEQIADASLMDAVDRPAAWTRSSLAAAVDGLAALHAVWYGRERDLVAAPWIGTVPTTRAMSDMTDLWVALANHAEPAFSSWTNTEITSIQRGLIQTVERWWPSLEHAPRTLIHHDFNPRNICIRGTGSSSRLCAYDWELATLGAPQRDLAELLCFVLSPDAERKEAQVWIDRHRAQLSRETECQIDAAVWEAGFRAALCDVLINRLATYALIHRVRPQRFLPRVVRTWRRLHQLFPLEAAR
jgi:thioester reductase-like protein